MADSIYCYKNTSILKNKFNIINPEKLNQVERELTSIRVHDLIRKPIKGNFDFKHLCAIHFYIFQDIYMNGLGLLEKQISQKLICFVM